MAIKVGLIGLDARPLPGAQVTEDMDWLPSISAQVNVPAEDAVDARLGLSVELRITEDDLSGVSNAGLWEGLMLRRCSTDYVTGVAALSLESTDMLLLETRHNAWRAPATWNLQRLVEAVATYLDPGGYHVPASAVIMDSAPNFDVPIGDLTDELPVWERGEPASSYISALGDVYGFRLQAGRFGYWTAAEPRLPIRTVPQDEILALSHTTDRGEFYNYAHVAHSETGQMIAELKAPAPLRWTGPTARAMWTHDALSADPARMLRALSIGETWQVTCRSQHVIQPLDRVHVRAPRYGVDFTERVSSITHTSDGTMTMRFHPTVDGE